MTSASDIPGKVPDLLRDKRRDLWAGYRSYEYLSPSPLTPTFEFVEAVGRVPEASVTWSEETETRARAIEETTLVVSAHDHLSLRPQDPKRFAEYRRSGREATPYEGIANAGVDVFFDGGPAAVSMIRSHTPFDWDDTVSDLGMRAGDWQHQSLVRQVRSRADIDVLASTGQVGVVQTLEAATAIGNDIDRLDVLFGLGVRLLGIAYSESNQLGGGLSDVNDSGLTVLGRRAVQRMNELGIIIDVSHANDMTALDVFRHSQSPVVISHAGARGLWNTARMKPDDVIRACAETGGFIGIEAAPHTTEVRGDPVHSLETVMRHVEYCIELVGPEHVAFGPDTNFGDHVAWHHEFAPLFGFGGKTDVPKPDDRPHDEIEFVSGCENPGEAVPNMIRWLVDRGYSETDVRLIAGANVLRVADAVWPR